MAVVAVAALAVSGVTATTIPVAASTGTNVITGTVIDENDPAGTAVEGVVDLYDASFGIRASVFLNSSTPPSSFSFTSVPDGVYQLQFRVDDSGYLLEWWRDATGLASAETITVSGGQTSTIQASVAQGGVISGIATVGGGDRSVIAEAHSLETGQVYSSWSTSTPGGYEIRALPPGTYVVQFRTYDSRYIPEWWNDVPSRDLAEVITIVGAETVPNIDADLDRAAIVSGTVVDESGQPINNAFVIAVAADDPSIPSYLDFDHTDTQGRFDLDSLPGGDVLIRVSSPGNHVSEWHDNAESEHTATPVPAVLNQQTMIGEIELATGGRVTGRVTLGPTSPLRYAVVRVVAVGTPFAQAEHFDETDATGAFEVQGLAPGHYQVHVSRQPRFDEPPYTTEWFDNAQNRQSGRVIEVTAGGLVTNIDTSLDRSWLLTNRIAGPDRYATAAAMTDSFQPGVDVVYIANGRNFPDALGAAAAAAFLGGPLMLVEPTSIPAPVATALERLEPDAIVIVGDSNSVSVAVESSLQAYVGTGGVRRDAGVNRYETSRMIAERAFADSRPSSVLIATGANFPDALSGAAWAGPRGLPVLLVNGGAASLDDATRATLETLGVRSAVIAGGTPSVSAGIEADLDELFDGRVERIAGANRYITAVDLSREAYYPGVSNTVYLASGLGFPDALAGAALAGNSPAPLLLVPGNCVPAVVRAEIDRLTPRYVTVFGSEATLTRAVADLVPCGW